MDSLVRSVGRANGHPSLWDRLFHRKSKLRRGHAEIDFRPQDEDVWRVLRDI